MTDDGQKNYPDLLLMTRLRQGFRLRQGYGGQADD
jgi:hypothetical protein